MSQDTGGYYLFSNVAYAVQPVGDLRFKQTRLPTDTRGSPPLRNSTGSETVQCVQAFPQWVVDTRAQHYGVSPQVAESMLRSQAGQTESCLVLDVYAPAFAVHKNKNNKNEQDAVPVVVWIHGGGFTYGSKTSTGNPAGLISRAGQDGIVFVAINYRLGLYGWLGSGDGTTVPNLGLYDQLLALDWVQKYIGHFGGDPAQVTVLGESAGASSLLHHITARGGEGPAPPFQRAVLQSPAFQFNLDPAVGYREALAAAANVTGRPVGSAADLLRLSGADLAQVNQKAVVTARYGEFNFGPVVDGTYVPRLPQVLLGRGQFHRTVALMTGHNTAEGVPFVPPTVATPADAAAAVHASLPEASDATVAFLVGTLYPAAAYATPLDQVAQMETDAALGACTTRFAALASANATYNYLFAVPPAWHGEDTAYTFFNGDTSPVDGVAVAAGLAHALQDAIVAFAVAADPGKGPAAGGPGTVGFPLYGPEAQVWRLGSEGAAVVRDDMDNPRCPWWQQAMADGLV